MCRFRFLFRIFPVARVLCSVIILIFPAIALSSCKFGDVPENGDDTKSFIDDKAIPNLPNSASISGDVKFGGFWNSIDAKVSGMFDTSRISVTYTFEGHTITQITTFSGTTTLQLDNGPAEIIYSPSANSPSQSSLGSALLLGRSALRQMTTERFDPFNYVSMKHVSVSEETTGDNVSVYHLTGYIPRDYSRGGVGGGLRK